MAPAALLPDPCAWVGCHVRLPERRTLAFPQHGDLGAETLPELGLLGRLPVCAKSGTRQEGAGILTGARLAACLESLQEQTSGCAGLQFSGYFCQTLVT